MVQTTFESAKIGEVLELIVKTVPEVWNNITLSQTNMDTWPEQGNNLELDQTPTFTTDADDEATTPAHTENSTISANLFADGSDEGPAPLQNIVNPTDVYEVIVDTLNGSKSANETASTAVQDLEFIAEEIRNNESNTHAINTKIPIPMMKPNAITTQTHQSQVVTERGRFVD